jgi:cytosine/adenosine deaminase-related metal-dependent hydrolase
MLDGDHVLITDEQGKIDAIVSITEAGDDIQQVKGVLSPGFINCHCHLELSHMKGLIPEQTGLVDFVFKVVTERHFPDEAITEAIAHAEKNMIEAGTVAVGDICNNLSTLGQKQKGNLAYYNFIETSGWLPDVAQTRFDRSRDFYEVFETIQNATCNPARAGHNSLSPHAPYSVSDRLWELMQPYFAGKTVTIHNQETAFEDALFESGSGDFTRMYEMMKLDNSFFNPTGKSSLQSYLLKMRDAREILLVHNTFTREEDILFVRREASNVNWCICINANQYIEKAVPPVDLLLKHNCPIVVGTDSLASNHSLSVLEELKTIHQHFPSIPLSELLRWATSNGARALQMNEKLGNLENGKSPGVVLIEGLENGNISSRSTSKKLI